MATQIYEIYHFHGNPENKEILTKDEVRQFCKHYNQHTSELEDFLNRFNFEHWNCIGVDIEDIYSPGQDPYSSMDSSPPAFLGLLLTSLREDKYELALKKYLDQGNPKFFYDGQRNKEGIKNRFFFNEIDDCPLWVVEVSNFEKYKLAGVVLLPTEFWNSDAFDSESYGYPYTVDTPGSTQLWYHWDRCIEFNNNRIGQWSPNFLSHKTIDQKVSFTQFHTDSNMNRLFGSPIYGGEINYLELGQEESLKVVPDIEATGMHIKDDTYHFHTKKGILVTDKEFKKLDLLTTKKGLIGNLVFHEYEEKKWKVVVSKKGLQISSHKAEKKDKLSAFKLKANDVEPSNLIIHAIDENTLVLINDALIIFDADLTFEKVSLKRTFKKQLTGTLRPSEYSSIVFDRHDRNVVQLPKQKTWFFLGRAVMVLNDKNEPALINEELKKLCGEYIFYGAVADPELEGVWLLAGLGRIVFIQNDLTKAFVFNSEELGCRGLSEYANAWIGFDKNLNLYHCLNQNEGIKKVDRTELVTKLKTAIPFSSK